MREYPVYKGTSYKEIQAVTGNLDSAKIVPLKMDDGGVVKDIENFVGVYNVSKGLFCTSVVPYYNLIQHKDYFNSFAKALERLNIKYNMSVKQCGNKAFEDIDFVKQKFK